MSPCSPARARFTNCAWVIGVFVFQLGCLVLIGWALNNRALTTTFTYLVPMNPMTALCFVLLGAALTLSCAEMAGSTARRLACKAALAVVMIIGALRLVDALLGWSTNVDWLLFPEQMAVATAYGIVRMAPTTALCVVLTGLSLASLDLSIRGRRVSWPSQALGFLVALVSLVTLASFASGLRSLPATLVGFAPMALNTACAFLALTFGMFCARPDKGLISLLQSTQPGGAMARRLFPAVVLVPLVWLVWRVIRRLAFNSPQIENGTSLIIASLTVGLAAVICWTAVSLNQADSQRRQAEEKMRESRDLARKVVESTSDAVFVKDLQGRYLSINTAGARGLGRSPEAIIGHDDTASFDLATAQKIIERDRSIMATGETITYEDIDLCTNGQTRTWQSTKGPLRDQHGEVIGLIGIARDITANKRAERALQEEVAQRRLIEQALQTAHDDLEARVQARTAELACANESVRESEERLRLALNAGRMSTWTIHVGTDEVDWSTVRHSKGWIPGTFPETFEAFLGHLHPDDLDAALAVFARCKAEGAPFIFQYRFVRPGDGMVRWVESRGQPLRGATGCVDTITGVSLDITGRKLQEARLHAHARQQAAVASLGQRALELANSSLEVLMIEVADLVADLLEADFTTVFEHLPAENLCIRRAGRGWPKEAINSPDAGAPADITTVAGYTLLTGQPAVCEDISRETRFHISPYGKRHGAVAIASVLIVRAASGDGPAPAPFGVLNAIFRKPHVFSDEDITFMQAVANILASAIASQRAQEAIQQARQEADRANLAKSEFLSRMSHELRTPLNAILGFSQLLEMDDLKEKQRDGVTYIISGGRHLLKLIDEVLDIARVESGRIEMSTEAVAIHDLVRESLALISPLAAERGIALEMRGSADGEEDAAGHRPHVTADRQRLKQVLLNLLSNAVKYNAPGGRVTLDYTLTPGPLLRLRVADTGPGIPAESRARLFTPFDRLGAEHGAVQGTGLGLALSKRLMEAMGGDLGLEENPASAPAAGQPDQGAVFWLALPLAADPLDALATAHAGALPPPARVEPLPGGRTLLYIEDNLSNLTLVERLMEAHPEVRLLTAMQGAIGLDLARQHRPDLILLDVHLPDLPGWEVLARLHTEEATRDIPVVVISADATDRQIKRLQQAGAHTYLTKPLDVKKFLETVREALLTSGGLVSVEAI